VVLHDLGAVHLELGLVHHDLRVRAAHAVDLAVQLLRREDGPLADDHLQLPVRLLVLPQQALLDPKLVPYRWRSIISWKSMSTIRPTFSFSTSRRSFSTRISCCFTRRSSRRCCSFWISSTTFPFFFSVFAFAASYSLTSAFSGFAFA